MIPFNKPPFTGNEEKYILESIKSSKISGDGEFTKGVQNGLKKNFNLKRFF